MTKILSETSKPASPDSVAKSAVHGIKLGLFSVPCNFEGSCLSIATCGMAPQPSFWRGIFEIFTVGILRLVALFTLAGFQRAVKKWHREHEK